MRLTFYHTKLANIESKAVKAFINAFPDYGGRIFGRNGKQDGSKFCYELYLTDTATNYDILKSCGFEAAQEVPLFYRRFCDNDRPKQRNKK